MNTQRIKDPDVRHAIALAIDRQGTQSAYGGDVYGAIADSVIPPDVPGYAPADLALKSGGDPESAKKLLEGKSVPPIHMAVNDKAGPARSKEISLIEAPLACLR